MDKNNIDIKHIVSLSGGVGSYFTLKRVLEKYGKENVIALFLRHII